MEATPLLAAGFYTVVIRAENSVRHETQMLHFIVTSAAAVAVTPNQGPGYLHVFDKASGRPLAYLEVSGFVEAASDSEIHDPLPAAKTDRDGFAPLPALVPDQNDYAVQDLVLLAGGQPLLVTRFAVSDYLNPTHRVIDVVVDRKLYRPGETVHWKIIARTWREGRLVVPTEKPRMTVHMDRDSNAAPLFSTDLGFDSFGTAHGDFVLPPTATVGSAFLNLVWPGAQKQNPDGERQTFMFSVDHFVAPAIEAKIDLASSPDSLRPGQVITVRSTARYLSGGQVVGCPVTFTLNGSTANWWSLTVEQQRRAESWQKEIKQQSRTAVTDAEGNAEIRLALPYDLLPGTRLEIQATFLPEGGQPVQESVAWNISPTGLTSISSDSVVLRFVRPGEEASFSATTQDGRGQPGQFEGIAQLVEKKWNEAWLDPDGTLVSGAPLDRARKDLHLTKAQNFPARWTRLHAGYGETALAEHPVTTNAQGEITTSFVIPHAGLFALRLKTTGQISVPSETHHDYSASEEGVVAFDETSPPLELRPDATALLGPSVLAENEPLRLHLLLPEGPHWALVAINGDDHAVVRRVAVQGRVGYLEISDLPRFTGKGTATLVATDQPAATRPNRVSTTFNVNPAATHLDLTVSAAAESARPGAAATVTIHAKSKTNPSTPVQFSLAVTDESVNRLAGYSGREPLPFHTYSKTVTSFPGVARNSDETVAVQLDPRPGARHYAEPLGMEYLSSSPLEAWVERMDERVGYTATSTLAGTRMGANIGGKTTGEELVIRTHFDATASWAPEIVTNAQGEATVAFKYPDSLTQWRLEAYAVGADGNSFGRSAFFTQTSLPLQTRLQLPRFLVAGDTAEPSVLLLNRSEADFNASSSLALTGPVSAIGPDPLTPHEIAIPAKNEAHRHWTVQASRAGTAQFTVTSHAGAENDGMTLTVPVLEDGVQQVTAATARLAPTARQLDLKLTLPEPFDPHRTQVTLQLTNSHAAVVLDALPYLVDYPYGCVEQTMSRFLPAVVALKTLRELGLEARAVEQRILAGESAADTQRRAGTAGLTKLDDVVQKSLGRLIEAQQRNGGFGWWPGGDTTNAWMTAYVAWGLGLARDAGVGVPENLEQKTWRALEMVLSQQSRVTDEQAWALAAQSRATLTEKFYLGTVQAAFARNFAGRDQLSAAGRACLALASVRLGDAAQRAILLRNLENGAERVHRNDEGDTVHWGKTARYWNASEGAVETTSLTLLALLELDPHHALVEPAMNWLVLNRRSSHWLSTRDSAFAVLALTAYIAHRHELDGELEADVLVRGKKFCRVILNRASFLKSGTTLEVPAALLRAGTNSLTLKRASGTGPLYATAVASAWATGDAVKPVGHQIDVTRSFIRQKAERTVIGNLRIASQPLRPGGSAVAGEQVTARVTLTVPNDLEYVMIAVPKPAGCEPLNPLSGWDARIRRIENPSSSPAENQSERTLYREEQDDRSVFFLERLAAGTWEIRFGLRATTPGNFRALPAQATALYVPEIAANSEALRVMIDRAEKKN